MSEGHPVPRSEGSTATPRTGQRPARSRWGGTEQALEQKPQETKDQTFEPWEVEKEAGLQHTSKAPRGCSRAEGLAQNPRTGRPFKVTHREGADGKAERQRGEKERATTTPRRDAERAQGDRGPESGGGGVQTEAGAPRVPSSCRMNQEDVCGAASRQGKAEKPKYCGKS